MLAYLKGTIEGREITGGPVDKVLLDVNDIGYELNMAHASALSVGAVGDAVKIYVSVAIRETEWTIFGFKSPHERQLFNLLQSVSGIGPKLALGCVGALGVETLVEAILSDNPKMISQAPGVGPKVAQKIIIDLKTKIEDFARSLQMEMDGADGDGSQSASNKLIYEEAIEILANLGYTATEIHQAIKKVKEASNDVDSAEEVMRLSLKILGSAAKG